MGRSPCCSKVGLRRGPWSTIEDTLLSTFILENGEGQWRSLPKKAGLLRCGKSCRLRWMNYLRPGIKRGNISQDEEDLIVRLHRLLGNRWSLIAGRLPGRTDNEIKNYWNTHLHKKLQTAGILLNGRRAAESPADPGAGARKKNNSKQRKAPAVPKEKTKVYLPKPIRVSPEFSGTSSFDSLASGGGAAAEVAWPSIFELEDGYGGGAEDFLGPGCILPPHVAVSGDVGGLEQVYYDEYLQLLCN